ncbi:hypothetical protein AAFC00_003648 [Neodothiora populina]
MKTVMNSRVWLHMLLASIVCARQHIDYAARNLDTISKIYNLTVYPNNLPIVQHGAAAVPPGLFNVNATGRVTPLGNFTGFDDSVEYFFALAPLPQANGAGVGFYEAEVVEFTSGCPEVAASVVYLRSGQVNQTTGAFIASPFTTTLKQVAFWNFDEDGLVLKYDAWIPNLQAYTRVGTGVDFSNVTVQQGAATGLCPVIQQRCTESNQQYSDVATCIEELDAKPFGNFDEAWGDNLACRTIHLILTQVRPEVHCPHVGPNGGNGPDNYKCVDIDYSVLYFNDPQLFGQPEGQPFTCHGHGYRSRRWDDQ